MSSVHVQAELTSDELIRAIGQLNKRDFNRVFQQMLALNAQRKAPCLSKDESELFGIINQGLPSADRQRFNYLVERRQSEQITEPELAELIELSDRVEEIDARRAEAIGKLAALRNVPFDDILKSLGLKR